MSRLLLSALLLSAAACAGKNTAPAPAPEAAAPAPEAPALTFADILQSAATGAHRSAENIARNEYRHPVETLHFFGLRPDMTVVELRPGSGWYTEILAAAVTEGSVVAASAAPKADDPEHYRSRNHAAMAERIASDPVFGSVTQGIFQPGEQIAIGEPGSADLVLTFRNLHGWYEGEQTEEVLAAVHAVLKPGGVFGVVQHRAAEGTDPTETAPKGYLPEQVVIDLVTAAGFELVDRSDVNANPRDTRDYAEGVWTLPPSLSLGDVDRDTYVAIGESDRMTLKFMKSE